MFKKSYFDKQFYKYYLLVLTILVLTIVIQSITQHSLKKQEHYALLINIAGKQRMLGQQILTDFYECRLLKCNYADMKLDLEHLYNTNTALQKGSAGLGLKPLEAPEIQQNFNKLRPNLDYIYKNLKDVNTLEQVSFIELYSEVYSFLDSMETIVDQFQKQAEDDLKTLMIVELELAALSVLIILFEIIFILNPAMRKITVQNKKLKEVSWHQSHAFNSHIKNIRDLQHIVRIEKNMGHKQELLDCVMDELNDLEKVSKNMISALESHTD